MASEKPGPQASIALRVLVAILCGAVLYFAQAALIPVALAMLFALVLSSPVESLHRQGLPRSASAVLILVTFLALAAGGSYLLREPAEQWLAAAPRTFKTIEQKIDPAARFIHRIDAVTTRAGRLTDSGDASSPPQATIAPATAPGGILLETRAIAVALVTVVILTLFLLGGGPPVLARMAAALKSDVQATHVLKVIEAVRSEVGHYYATLALINLGLGVATTLVMLALGMPNPLLWGVLAGLFNFIPYIGSATTLVVLTIVAFISFDGIGPALGVSASFLALVTIEGQIVQPLLVGQRHELNPIIVFLALWFCGWLWGIAGIVMAVPTLVTLKVVAEHSDWGTPVIEFLSPSYKKRFKPREIVAQPFKKG
jgi:predicted PurR-regulated permease PerM